jgi:hypothetical protein
MDLDQLFTITDYKAATILIPCPQIGTEEEKDAKDEQSSTSYQLNCSIACREHRLRSHWTNYMACCQVGAPGQCLLVKSIYSRTYATID